MQPNETFEPVLAVEVKPDQFYEYYRIASGQLWQRYIKTSLLDRNDKELWDQVNVIPPFILGLYQLQNYWDSCENVSVINSMSPKDAYYNDIVLLLRVVAPQPVIIQSLMFIGNILDDDPVVDYYKGNDWDSKVVFRVRNNTENFMQIDNRILRDRTASQPAPTVD